jgi:hypothetical protein
MSEAMGMLRVGVHQLPAAQAGLVRALIQLLSRSSSEFRWTFAHEAPYDALIVDCKSPDLREPKFQSAARALSVLGPPEQAASAPVDVLDWPLRAERLESWLTQVQQRVLVNQPLACEAAPASTAGTRYRLKRWPPEALMRGDAQRIRLAVLLSRRPLLLTELEQLSGQDPARCQVFLQLLQSFALVEVVTALAQPTPEHLSARAEVPVPIGLIQSIRRRLGI